MKKSVLVDTAAWFALLNKSDALHEKAKRIRDKLVRERGQFLLTDYIVVEIANALSRVPFRQAAVQIISLIQSSASPTGFVLQVLTGFMLNADVGLLPAGNYQAIASLFVDGVFHDRFSASFNVVPEPGTWQLLIIGFVSMWLVSRGKIKMCPVR